MTDLTPATTAGQWSIRTVSGAEYLIDLDNRTLSRLTSEAASPEEGYEQAQMRRDGETVELIEVTRAVVGEPGLFWVNLNVPNVFLTHRQTTPIVSIEQLVPAGSR